LLLVGVALAMPACAWASPAAAHGPAGSNPLREARRSTVALIAFVRNGDIWTMRPDGSHQRNLTKTSHIQELSPTWSPSRDRIAYLRGGMGASDGRGHLTGELWTMRSDGSHKGRMHVALTTQEQWRSDHMISVAWSHNGTWLALSNVDARGEWLCRILLLSARTGKIGKSYASGGVGVLSYLHWRPDGRKISCTWSYGASLAPQLWIIDTASGKHSVPTYWHPSQDIGYAPLYAAWSPKGSTIAYVEASEQHSLPENEVKQFLATTPVKGSGHRVFCSCSSVHGDWLEAPAWSADGTKIAYERRHYSADGSSHGRICVLTRSTGKITTIADNGSDPAW